MHGERRLRPDGPVARGGLSCRTVAGEHVSTCRVTRDVVRRLVTQTATVVARPSWAVNLRPQYLAGLFDMPSHD